jgi:hypothetical protein
MECALEMKIGLNVPRTASGLTAALLMVFAKNPMAKHIQIAYPTARLHQIPAMTMEHAR